MPRAPWSTASATKRRQPIINTLELLQALIPLFLLFEHSNLPKSTTQRLKVSSRLKVAGPLAEFRKLCGVWIFLRQLLKRAASLLNFADVQPLHAPTLRPWRAFRRSASRCRFTASSVRNSLATEHTSRPSASVDHAAVGKLVARSAHTELHSHSTPSDNWVEVDIHRFRVFTIVLDKGQLRIAGFVAVPVLGGIGSRKQNSGRRRASGPRFEFHLIRMAARDLRVAADQPALCLALSNM